VRSTILVIALLACPGFASAQDSVQELQTQIQELRQESIEMRQQIEALRQELNALRSPQYQNTQTPATPAAAPNVQEEQQLLNAKVEEQAQTKVESGSKYRVRLSGIALINTFSVRGSVDNLDLPLIAVPRGPGDSAGAYGATVRQSRINLDVFGPEWKGMKTSGDISFDFYGGFPYTSDSLSSPLPRLRIATLKLDSDRTSIVAGQDVPFFSPRSPTSLSSSAYPALSYSGNIWTWTPQVQVERRFAISDNNRFSIQGGVLDPFTGELPLQYNRITTAGERSGLPAFATRLGWARTNGDREAGAGIGAYYSRQNWGYNRTVDSWAATADWDFPLQKWLSLSGEFYRGRAIGGLGAGASGSVVFLGSPTVPASNVIPLNTIGGWAQLNYKPLQRLEFNVAYGEDEPSRPNVRGFLSSQIAYGPPARNASGFANVIYTARSNLLFSLEYRRLWTSPFYNPRNRAGYISLSSGIAF
jgi:hypothetical protein